MASRMIHDCDRCKTGDISPIKFKVADSPVDVCWACAESLLQNLMAQLDTESANLVLKAITKKGSPS